jgi:ornithine cyclodeaminase/alanine dehydrogenase-like protein (mu-crystallin family)
VREGAAREAGTLMLSRRDVDDEIIVFDSTGTALQDVAAAAAVYRRAAQQTECPRFAFNA